MNQKQDNIKDNLVFIGEDDEEYIDVIEMIGEGSSSIAYKVIDKQTNQVMCKKVLKHGENTSFSKLQNSTKDYEVLMKLNHPSIFKVLGFNMHEKLNKKRFDSKNMDQKVKNEKEDANDYEYEYEGESEGEYEDEKDSSKEKDAQ